MRNFRTFDLAVKFYQLAQGVTLKGHLKDQLSRASLSIPLNLAEGRGRSTLKDQKRFFSIAMGSLRECQALIIVANLKDSELLTLLDTLAAHLYRLIQNAR